MSLWISLVDRYKAELWGGLQLTVSMTAASVAIGLIAGFVLFAMRLGAFRSLSIASLAVTEIFKGVPVLVTMFWLYLCIPLLAPSLRLSSSMAATVALSASFSAQAAEILRSSWSAIPMDLRRSLLLRPTPLSTRMVLFQAPLLAITAGPGLMAIVAGNLRMSGIAALIGVPELFHATQGAVQQTLRPIELYSLLALLYLAISLSASTIEWAVRQRFS